MVNRELLNIQLSGYSCGQNSSNKTRTIVELLSLFLKIHFHEALKIGRFSDKKGQH